MASNYETWQKREGNVRKFVRQVLEQKRLENIESYAIRRKWEISRDEVFNSNQSLKKQYDTRRRRKRERSILCDDDINEDMFAIFGPKNLKENGNGEKNNKTRDESKKELKELRKEARKRIEARKLERKNNKEKDEVKEDAYPSEIESKNKEEQNITNSDDKPEHSNLIRKNLDEKENEISEKKTKSLNKVTVESGIIKINDTEYKKGETVNVVLFEEQYKGEISSIGINEIVIKTKVDKMKIQISSLRGGNASISKLDD